MTKLTIRNFIRHQMFAKYALTGALITASELALLYILVDRFQWWYLLASSLVFFIGLVASFFLRKIFVFRNYDWSALPRQLFFYSAIWIFNILLNGSLMYFLVDWCAVDYLLAQVISNLFLGIIGFLFNKFITFKKFSRTRFKSQHHQLLEGIKRH